MNDAREILGQWIEEDDLRVRVERLGEITNALMDVQDQLPGHIRDAFRDAGLFVVNEDADEAIPTKWSDAAAVIRFELDRGSARLHGGVTFDEVAQMEQLS